MNAEVRHMKTAAELALAEAYAGARATLPGMASLREEAFKDFETRGLPHRRVEEWKYTDLRALMREAMPLAAPPDAQARQRAKAAGAFFASADCRKLVLVDGAFVPELSDLTAEPGLRIRSLADALADNDPLVARHLGKVLSVDDAAVSLNTAMMGDGVVVDIDAGATIARPILLVHAASGRRPASTFTRSLIVVGPRARVTIVESCEAETGDQANAVMELSVGAEAQVDHLKACTRNDGALQVSTLIAALDTGARFHAFSCVTAGAVTRNQTFARFNGKDIVAGLSGINLLQGSQHVDNTLVVEHVAPGCESRELFKSVLDDRSRAVFQGKIVVQPEAQKTDARMMTRALLLSEEAEADSKPELEIFADDVQCGHGATAGALDENLLFYLRARGIPQREAEGLMIAAFIGEAVETIAHEGLRNVFLEAADAWLKARGA